MATRAPEAANRRTVASPIPEAPPVTSAARIVRSAVIMWRNTPYSTAPRDGACAQWHAYPTIDCTLSDLNPERRVIMARLQLALDIGGTFTDVIMVDGVSGALWTAKTPSTPR